MGGIKQKEKEEELKRPRSFLLGGGGCGEGRRQQGVLEFRGFELWGEISNGANWIFEF